MIGSYIIGETKENLCIFFLKQLYKTKQYFNDLFIHLHSTFLT